jgi:hypothetical protein
MAQVPAPACQTAIRLEMVVCGFDFGYPNPGYLQKVPACQYPRGPGAWIINLDRIVLGRGLGIVSGFLGARSGFLFPVPRRLLQHQGP